MIRMRTARRRTKRWIGLGLACAMSYGVWGLAPMASAQEQQAEAPATAVDGAAPTDDEMRQRYEAFEEMLHGVKLTGRFSIVGRDEGRASNEEEYFITRVTKSTEGDYWVFNARIKYGDKDYSVPLPIEVKWAGDTPVVTLTDFTILGQGPFSARVVFYDGKYAGTWSHGEVSGHLIGTFEKAEPPRE